MPRPTRLLLAAACLLLAGPALASADRVRALGGVPDLVEDDSGVLRWYGAVVDYPDLGVLHLGDWAHRRNGAARGDLAGRGGGVHVQLDPDGRWGTAALHFGEDLPAPDPGGWIQAVWGRRFGSLSLALAFRATSWSDASSTPTAALDGGSRFLHLLGLGARWDLTDRTYVDLAADAQESEVDFYRRGGSVPLAEEDLGGWDSFGVRGRVFHELSDNLVWVGRLAWFRDTRPITDPVIDDLVDFDADHFRGGFACHLLPDPDNLVIISGDYRRLEDTRRARHPFDAAWERGWRLWWRIDARVAVESRVLPWLTLRAAASYRRHVDEQQYKYEWATDYTEIAYRYQVRVDTPVTVGAGLHLGQFDCDVVVNATAPFEVGEGTDGFLDGESTNLTGVTLRYAW
ncbi:MAG: hypothetical protein R3D98_11090 [Candidatus Krumholzibacteriia bacterium]